MTCRLPANGGQIKWSGSRDGEGGRTYTIVFRVESDDPLDGPSTVRATPGLPLVGAPWAWDNDFDPWAFCSPAHTIEQSLEGELYWDVTLTFATPKALGGPNTPGNQRRCNDTNVEDPLLEPPHVSFGSIKYNEEPPYDRFGRPICSSSFEPFRGQVNEWDANRTSVRIEMNVGSFALVALALSMRDSVNGLPLWGFDRRCIKLSNVNADRKFYGTCYAYYTLSLDFDINSRTFDRDILDEGHKCLKGHWDGATGEFVLERVGTGANARWPNRNNPTDFVRLPDRDGNPAKMVLNGYGLPGGATIRADNAASTDFDPLDYGWDNSPYVRVTNVQYPDGNPRASSPQIAGPDIWLPAGNWTNLSDVPFWNETTFYPPGHIVRQEDSYYISLAYNEANPPTVDNDDWLLATTLTDCGAWTVEDIYAVGDIVLPLNSSDTPSVVGTGAYRFVTRLGSRHVERYGEVNFLLLGIPLFF